MKYKMAKLNTKLVNVLQGSTTITFGDRKENNWKPAYFTSCGEL